MTMFVAVVAAKVSAGHAWHAWLLPSTPEYPALHWQAVLTMLPAGESEFAGQSTQPEFPVPDLYVPTKHRVQVVQGVLPSKLKLPAGHVVR